MRIAQIVNFFRGESGAVTVDWVVLTAGIVGLGLVVAGTVGGAVTSSSSTVAADVGTSVASAGDYLSGDGSSSGGGETTDFNGKKASDYIAYGQSKAPGNNGAAYYWAGQAAAADAPSGYNFDNPLYDAGTGDVVYTSNDGSKYSVGGKVYSKATYSGTLGAFTA